MEMGEKYSADYPSLTRDTGAGILAVIANAKGLVPLYKDIEFETDDLWCEGVYTIDLDAETFTTKWDSETYTFTFDEIRSMSSKEYAERCDDKVAVQSLDRKAPPEVRGFFIDEKLAFEECGGDCIHFLGQFMPMPTKSHKMSEVALRV